MNINRAARLDCADRYAIERIENGGDGVLRDAGFLADSLVDILPALKSGDS